MQRDQVTARVDIALPLSPLTVSKVAVHVPGLVSVSSLLLTKHIECLRKYWSGVQHSVFLHGLGQPSWQLCRSQIVAIMPVPVNVLLVMLCAWKALR